jgi:hypothetical protein
MRKTTLLHSLRLTGSEKIKLFLSSSTFLTIAGEIRLSKNPGKKYLPNLYVQHTANTMIYYDNTATSWPKPPEVHQAMTAFLQDIGANPGFAGHHIAETMLNAGKIVNL